MTLLAIFEALVGANAIWEITVPWERTAVFASLFLIDIDTIYKLL